MNPTCIIVDDNTTLRDLLCDRLKFVFPTVEFTSAATGEEAFNLALLLKPQVVLMDIRLPGISGIESTRRIKSVLPETNIIIYTFCEERAYQEAAALAGADSFVFKSNTMVDLVPTLRKAFPHH